MSELKQLMATVVEVGSNPPIRSARIVADEFCSEPVWLAVARHVDIDEVAIGSEVWIRHCHDGKWRVVEIVSARAA